MLVAPILCAYPDGTLPATNDCWYFTGLIDECCHGVPPAPAFYEVAAAWYDEPLFGQVLRRAYQHGPHDSLDRCSLDLIRCQQKVWCLSLASVHLPDSGYAILRGQNQPSMNRGRAVPDCRCIIQLARSWTLPRCDDASGHPGTSQLFY